MAKRIIGTTPKQDGYRMPGRISKSRLASWMIWPERNDNWRKAVSPLRRHLPRWPKPSRSSRT